MFQTDVIRPLDPDALHLQARTADPFPHLLIDDFLAPDFARSVAESFPSFNDALRMGDSFKAVNEYRKVQVTDSSRFAEPVAKLNEALAAPEFLELLGHVFSIPKLVADDKLAGGGIHQTGARGHLDVHVDFNYLRERQLHRRLNILVYFNPGWRPEWGGNIELWDREVKVCKRSFSPVFNRCVIFETSGQSFHGVSAVTCPENVARKSFAAYYYTREAPAGWDGTEHTTIFRARPNEHLKRHVLMPLERAQRNLKETLRGVKRSLKSRL